MDQIAPARLLIKEINKLFVQDQNETVFDITVSFYLDDVYLEDRRFSYPLSTSIDDLKLELAKVLNSYNTERQQAVNNAEADNVNQAADEAIEALTGAEISPEGAVTLNEQPAEEGVK